MPLEATGPTGSPGGPKRARSIGAPACSINRRPSVPVRRSRQKPRFLPAVTKLMSAEIAAGDFGQ
jgi:hypothetical protein